MINKAIYITVGLGIDGKKGVLYLWLDKNELTAFWMTVLTDIKVRGTQGVPITATDSLNGFTIPLKRCFLTLVLRYSKCEN